MLDIMYDIPSPAEHQGSADLRGGRRRTASSRSSSTRRPPRRPEQRRTRRGHGERSACSSGTTSAIRRRPPHGGELRVPLLPLRDIIVFPHMVVPLFVGREKSIRALEEAMNKQKADPARRPEGRQDQRARRGRHLPRRHARHGRPAAPPARRHGEGAGRGQAARAHQQLRRQRRVLPGRGRGASRSRATRPPRSRR